MESRKELKEKYDLLEKENQILKGRLVSTTPAVRPVRAVNDEATPSPQFPDNHDVEGGPSSRPLFYSGSHRSQTPGDDSIEVEYPSFADEGSRTHQSSGRSLARTASGSRSHPTARTFSYNMNDPLSSLTNKRKPHRSKYFAGDESDDDPDLDDIEEADRGSEAGNDPEAIIPASTPIRPSPTKRSRTNPFSTTREAQNGRTKLAPIKKYTEVIDVSSSSPRSPLKASAPNVPEPSRQRHALMDLMKGMTDKNGRPTKGLASGAKVRHRA